jgi:16S rRNA (cytidine1402-2'-O)-methyltransferase
MSGKLYLVATPIGNLQDMTFRAIDILKQVDIIACEDTRHSQKLLNHFGIKKKLISYHQHNEDSRADELIRSLMDGSSVAVISDAGTPAINDPGFRIVRKAIEAEVEVVSIPGPSALIAALSVSGLPTDSFVFAGFLPAKKGERQRRLRDVADIPATLIFYETPHRLASSLKDCLSELGDREAVVARELTKIHEEYWRGPLSELVERSDKGEIKGEIVLLIDRASTKAMPAESEIRLPERVKELELSGVDRKTAMKQAAKELGLSRSEAYRELQNAKKS